MADELVGKADDGLLRQLNESDDSDDTDDDDYVPSDHAGDSESGEDDEEQSREASTNGYHETDSQSKTHDISIPDLSSTDKAKADALWTAFLTDVGPKAKKEQPKSTSPAPPPSKPHRLQGSHAVNPSSTSKGSNSTDVAAAASPAAAHSLASNKTKTPELNNPSSTSGPSGLSSSQPGKRPGGLSAVLGFINKKQKISTLDKSKLDWEKYKAEAGLKDELRAHTSSKNTYLDKKEFLERAELREYEQERQHKLSSIGRRPTPR